MATPNVVKGECEAYIEENYCGYLKIYTDGSKNSSGCGAGFYVPDKNHGDKIPSSQKNSFYSAELTAIQNCLAWVKQQVALPDKVVVLSDSLSALLAIQRRSTDHHMILLIFLQLLELTRRNVRIKLVWIPGHYGIGYNDVADELAKEAAMLRGTNQNIIFSMGEAKTQSANYAWIFGTTNINHQRPEATIKDSFKQFTGRQFTTQCRSATPLSYSVCTQDIVDLTPN